MSRAFSHQLNHNYLDDVVDPNVDIFRSWLLSRKNAIVFSSKPKTHSGCNVTKSDNDEYSKLLCDIASHRSRPAFEKLFVHYAPKIKAILIKQGANPEIAEDLMQETMLTVWNKAEQYANNRGSPNAWIFTIARNKRIDRLRKRGTKYYVDIDDYEIIDDLPLAEDELMANQRDKIVSEATKTLPDDQREVINMSFVQDLSQTQIAEKLGIPLGTVKSRLRLAYQKIKINLEGAL